MGLVGFYHAVLRSKALVKQAGELIYKPLVSELLLLAHEIEDHMHQFM